MDDGRSTLRRSAAHVFVDGLQPDGRDGDVIAVDADTEHHLDRVLRLREGEPVTASDGRGSWCATRIVRRGGLALERCGETHTEPRIGESLSIATAIPKGDRVEWLVQKASEVGVDRIVLLHCDRSVVRWRDERAERQRRRLQRIADEASRQSRRVWRVTVEGPVPSVSMLATAAVAEPGGRSVAAEDTLIAIGPEGGWSPEELELARDRVDLGSTVLRTETAAVVAAALAFAARRAVGG